MPGELRILRQHIQVLHVAYTRFPADTRVKRETAALRAAGYQVAVIALRGRGERAVERQDGVVVIRVPGRKSRGSVLSYLAEYGAFLWRCRRLIATHRAFLGARIVHVHTLPDFLLWSALPAQRRGARVIFDMHEILPEFTASKLPPATAKLAARLAAVIERWARGRADLTITVNRPIEELLASRPARRSERRLVLHNTADPADFGEMAEPSQVTGGPNIVYHGTLTALYGVDLAIRAIAEVRRNAVPAQLTIIGDGPERSALQRLAARLGVTDAIEFVMPMPQAALPAILRHAAAGVVPTRLDGMTRYSLSTKLLEYVHLGIPVLAARLPSYQRYLDEDALWYWTPGDVQDLAHALIKVVAAAPAERARRAARARAAITPFAWAREQRRLVAAYADLLAAAGNCVDSTAAIRSAAAPSP